MSNQSDVISVTTNSAPSVPHEPKLTAAQGPLPSAIAAPLNRSWTVEQSFEYCTRLTRAHYENFPVGSWLTPKSIQPAIHSLYAFMRTADDFSDEERRSGDEQERLAYLNTWEAMLSDCERGQASHPIFIALGVTIHQYKLPVQWLRDLLAAFKLDCVVTRYPKYSDLLQYCRYSANPVGRLILTLFGYRSEELYRLSDAICTGLQLANHWQDVAIDIEKDRVYLPQHHLEQFRVSVDDLRAKKYSENFKQLLTMELATVRSIFDEGKALPCRVSGRLRWELDLTWRGGVRILDKIEAADYDVFSKRPVLNTWDWLNLLLQSVFSRCE